MSDEYTQQARAFLDKYHLRLTVQRVPFTRPPWETSECEHRQKYRIKIIKPDGREITFPFWGSQHDYALNKCVSAYDVLSCLSSDAYSPTTADEVYAEFGEMKPSQAQAVADFAKRLQEFFTQEELEDLADIR